MKATDKPQFLSSDAPLFRHSLILFDGVCNLCDHTVKFILKRDSDDCFRFVPMQSPLGSTLLRQFGYAEEYRDSFVLIEVGFAYTQSTAFIRISKRLRSPWPLFVLIIVIPRCIRDRVYAYIGRNRYRWLGRHEYCEMPEQSLNHRFITHPPSSKAD